MGFASLSLLLDAQCAKVYHRQQKGAADITAQEVEPMEKDPNVTITIRYNPRTDQVEISFPSSLSPALLGSSAEDMLAAIRLTLLEHRRHLS